MRQIEPAGGNDTGGLPPSAAAASRGPAWWQELRALSLWVCLPVGCLLVAAVALKFRLNVPASELTRDPLAVFNAPPHIGVISNIGMLLWATSASACLFCAAVLSNRDVRVRRFLLASGALTGALLLDDLFMLHEAVVPALFGFSEKALLGAYAVATLLYLYGFRRELLRWRSTPLAAALGLFAASVLIDATQPATGLAQFAEDAAKFAGIASWCAFHLRTCVTATRDALVMSRADAILAIRNRPAEDLSAAVLELVGEFEDVAQLARSAREPSAPAHSPRPAPAPALAATTPPRP